MSDSNAKLSFNIAEQIRISQKITKAARRVCLGMNLTNDDSSPKPSLDTGSTSEIKNNP